LILLKQRATGVLVRGQSDTRNTVALATPRRRVHT